MDPRSLINGLILYLSLLALLTFHEFGHAWTAWKCGDDTARLQGRVSLNPLVHIDPIGTVLFPLLAIFLPALGGFLVGWAKPVPVNSLNLRHPRRDDILVTLAGPGMNLLLAIVLIGLTRLGVAARSHSLATVSLDMAELSLLLCFFNLIPIPPLDGSQIVRILGGFSHEAYHRFASYGFIILIVVLQLRPVQLLLGSVTSRTLVLIGSCFGMSL